MVETLSQEEIEALLASLTGDADDDGAEPATSAPQPAMPAPMPLAMPDSRSSKTDSRPIAYEVYDFRRPDKFSKDQMRTLQMLHETFARVFATSLSAYLRVATHVDLISVEQVPYDEYMRSLTSSIINVFSLPPLSGHAAVEMEMDVVLAMIDRLLGGPGKMTKRASALTEIERALMESIVTRAYTSLKGAWEGVAKFTPRHERSETQAQFVQIVPPNDVVISVLFEMKVGELRGAMSICMPYLLLKPISSKLSAQRWFSTSAKTGFGRDAATLVQQVERTRVTATCRLGTAAVTVGDLLALSVGDQLVLNRRSSDEVDLMIGGHVKFRGKVGIRGRKVALHVNRIITPDIVTD